MKVQVSVEGAEGTTIHEVDLDFEKLTLRESVYLEQALGSERTAEVMKGNVSESPSLFQAVIWAKLKTTMPDLELDGFDLDLDLIAEVEAPAPN